VTPLVSCDQPVCVTHHLTLDVLQGANQAVAAARLSAGRDPPAVVHFICRFGNDSYAVLLQQQLSAVGVDVSGCQGVPGLGSGQGLVMLEPDGAASSIVVGGANTAWSEVRGGRGGQQGGEGLHTCISGKGFTGVRSCKCSTSHCRA
jgi:sugar/nucleoside kinase (ribokinase family)